MNMIVAFISIKFGIVQSLLLNLRKKTVFEEYLTQKHRFFFCIFMNMNLALFQHLTPTTMAICFFNSNEPSPNQNYVKIVKISCIKTKPKRPEKNNKK